MWKVRREGDNYSIRCPDGESLDKVVAYLKGKPGYVLMKHSIYHNTIDGVKTPAHTDRIIIPKEFFSKKIRAYLKKHKAVFEEGWTGTPVVTYSENTTTIELTDS